MKGKGFAVIILVVAAAVAAYLFFTRPTHEIVLTGLVTTDEVIVSPEISGRVEKLYVDVGNTVTNGQLLARLQPEQWRADVAFYSSSEASSTAAFVQAKADLENA